MFRGCTGALRAPVDSGCLRAIRPYRQIAARPVSCVYLTATGATAAHLLSEDHTAVAGIHRLSYLSPVLGLMPLLAPFFPLMLLNIRGSVGYARLSIFQILGGPAEFQALDSHGMGVPPAATWNLGILPFQWISCGVSQPFSVPQGRLPLEVRKTP